MYTLCLYWFLYALYNSLSIRYMFLLLKKYPKHKLKNQESVVAFVLRLKKVALTTLSLTLLTRTLVHNQNPNNPDPNNPNPNNPNPALRA